MKRTFVLAAVVAASLAGGGVALAATPTGPNSVACVNANTIVQQDSTAYLAFDAVIKADQKAVDDAQAAADAGAKAISVVKADLAVNLGFVNANTTAPSALPYFQNLVTQDNLKITALNTTQTGLQATLDNAKAKLAADLKLQATAKLKLDIDTRHRNLVCAPVITSTPTPAPTTTPTPTTDPTTPPVVTTTDAPPATTVITSPPRVIVLPAPATIVDVPVGAPDTGYEG